MQKYSVKNNTIFKYSFLTLVTWATEIQLTMANSPLLKRINLDRNEKL